MSEECDVLITEVEKKREGMRDTIVMDVTRLNYESSAAATIVQEA